MIPFNKPCVLGDEKKNIEKCFELGKFSGDGFFTKECHKELERVYHGSKALLTTSCTDALEMSALLSQIKPGDEVILPSYTFVSTANAFALRGAIPVFIDIDPSTMNLDPKCVQEAITPRTIAVVAVHYAGWSCDMEELSFICSNHNLILIEDAAQAIRSTFKGKLLGSFGDFSTFSFHDTKNIHCGEGGALLVNNSKYISGAEVIREKGTNRSRFLRGEVDKYTWESLGSSYLPSELNAAFLLCQLQNSEAIIENRMRSWDHYKSILSSSVYNDIDILDCPSECEHNAHLFAIKVENLDIRTKLIDFLRKENIMASFHYVPLHTSPFGKKLGRFSGEDRFTTSESERLVRLPLYYDLEKRDVEFVCEKILSFFKT